MLRSTLPTYPRTFDELIDPKLIAQLDRLDIASRKVFAGKLKGERRSKRRGQSVEFADHRPYVVGDDLRFIDWNIYGRLDRLFLKLFLEEEDLSLSIVLDSSASMDCGDPSKYLFAQRLTAALAYIGLVNYNRVTLTAIGEAPQSSELDPARSGQSTAQSSSRASAASRPLPPGEEGRAQRNQERAASVASSSPSIRSVLRNLRGRRRLRELGSWLCQLPPGGSLNFPDAAKRIALTRQGRGVMVVISDFFFKEGYESGLRYLLGRGYDLVLIQVLSPQEVNPTLAGDLRLRDVEDLDRAEVTISAPLINRYKANLGAWCDGLRDFCARREITLLVVQSDLSIETLLLDYLRARGVLR